MISDRSETVDTIVIGGGVTGLAAGRLLAQKGERVHLIEREPRLGGAVRSYREAGYLCEAGPNSMLVKSQAVWEFIESLGLKADLVEANQASNKRFLVKRGRMVPLPQSLLGGVTTPLYNPLEKLRLLKEPFVGKSQLEDESVTSFVSRRMGPAFLEYGISALVSGIFAGNPDQLSLRHGFPKVWNLEQRYGSLIGGAVKLKRERKRTGEIPFKSRMISFREGLGQLVEALAAHDKFRVSLGVEVSSLERADDGQWEVLVGDTLYRSSCVVVTVPLSGLRQLPWDSTLQSRVDGIPQIDHPPLSTLVLGYDRSRVKHPLDGFGVLIPRLEKRFCLGCIFSSTLFPGRAPDGKVSLMCFIGGVQQPRNGQLPTARLIDAVVEDLRPLLGLSGAPEFHSHTYWPAAIPQYNVGHHHFIETLESTEAAFPGLHLLGNFRGGPGLNDCLQSALNRFGALS